MLARRIGTNRAMCVSAKCRRLRGAGHRGHGARAAIRAPAGRRQRGQQQQRQRQPAPNKKNVQNTLWLSLYKTPIPFEIHVTLLRNPTCQRPVCFYSALIRMQGHKKLRVGVSFMHTMNSIIQFQMTSKC